MAETVRRRRRPAVSCTLCRRRKIRCNRETPCSNCIRSKNEACVYDNEPVAHSQQLNSVFCGGDDTAPDSSPSSTAPTEAESLKSQIRHLEQQLKRAASQPSTSAPASSPASNVEARTSHMGGTFYIHHGNPALGQNPRINRSVTHKKRMFGQSHWMNYGVVLIRDIADMLDEHTRKSNQNESESTSLYEGMQQCKRLARVIKAQRTPAWPCIPSPDLPAKNIADELIDCYMRTSERIYRVLHIPSFRRDYEALWTTNAEPDENFLVLVKLVLAIGATVYSPHFHLRPSAVRWVYEAECWLANPSLKHRLGLQYIQIHILLIIAREMVAVEEDLVWVSAGSLLRSAVLMGLHRDPNNLPPRTTFANEMHRRLWNTITELSLQLSLNSGGPPLFSLEDFDTLPPSNLDDEQLASPDAVPKPANQFSQASIAIALRETLPARLAVCKFLNDFSACGAYEETLRLDTEYRASYRSLRTTFQSFDTHLGSPNEFEIRITEMIVHRFLCSLHMPFFSSGLRDSAHAYSRKVCVDASLKIWYAANLTEDAGISPFAGFGGSTEKTDVARVITCGNGFHRMSIATALLIIGVEFREQILEDDGLGVMLPRRDLVAILEDAKTWSLRCVEAGETNIKSHMFVYMMWAHVEALRTNCPRADIPQLLAKAVIESHQSALPVMQKMVEQCTPEQAVDELNKMSLDRAGQVFEDWDFMMQDVPFAAGNVDPMSWMLDPNMQSTFLW